MLVAYGGGRFVLNLDQIDHIQLDVNNRALIQKTYLENLDFTRVTSLGPWIEGIPFAVDNGSEHLGLFESKSIYSTTVTFSVTSSQFRNWQKHLFEHSIEYVLMENDLFLTMYFSDPGGTPFEIKNDECIA
ncbi:hypothetical protein [Photobacterium profundum]|uniref:Uncharacterized protein n=1 Tax=Photobacterium profundum 3TCK TaxID=314280 RepID=Q1Z3N2_9GAMM|nr:hypothetical protein [Photobacterium profundum]EAS43196.1 hypothetical protein P3TCK_09768 [Photobacterium profundum 3TCK]